MADGTARSKTTLQLNYEGYRDEHIITASLNIPKIKNKHLSFFTVIRSLYEYAWFIILIIFPATRKWSRAKIVQEEFAREKELETEERFWEVESDNFLARKLIMNVKYRQCRKATSTNHQSNHGIELHISKELIESEEHEREIQRDEALLLEIVKLRRECEYLKQMPSTSSTEDENLKILREQNKFLQRQLREAERFISIHNIITRYQLHEYKGMFQFRREDINIIIRNLITGLNPVEAAFTIKPKGLPAYVIFMCIRYADSMENEDAAHDLMTNFFDTLKNEIERVDYLEFLVLWLNSTLRLMNLTKQYSRKIFLNGENPSPIDEKRLRHLDMSEYREISKKMALSIYNKMINRLKLFMKPLVNPASIEREEMNLQQDNSSIISQEKLKRLYYTLHEVYMTLKYHDIEQAIIAQMYKQLFYFISTNVLNHILLKNDLCLWSEGKDIKYIMNDIQRWARDMMLDSAADLLQPVIQAAEIILSRKQDENIDSIREMRGKLTASEIIEILKSHMPVCSSGEALWLIREQLDNLISRKETSEELLMDSEHTLSVIFPFDSSYVRFQDITVPDSLNLSMLKKI